MSSGVKQPIGQKRLTNVAVVRYKKFGKKFEVACYKNKVVNWRNGVEKDLDEVLQTTTVFSNVSKAVVAKDEDLVEVFGTSDEQAVCLKILAEGDTQVSDKERELELSNLFRDVAGILAEKCINPATSRPYTLSMVERLLRELHFSVDPKRSAKQQALAVMPALRERFPIERARMRLKLQVPLVARDELMRLLQARGATLESQDLSLNDDQVAVVCLVDPGAFREVHAMVHAGGGGRGRLEVASLAAMEEATLVPQLAAMTLAARPAAAPGAALSAPDSSQPQPESRAGPYLPSGQAPTGSEAWGINSANGITREPAGTLGSAALEYVRGPIAGMPDEFAARRERFAELDELQPGWQVELRRQGRSETLDATFFSPAGQRVGAFVNARRTALAAYKAAQAQPCT